MAKSAPLSVPAAGSRLVNADGQKLRWLLEAPLFIDGNGIARLYDSVVRPAADEGVRIIEVERGGALEATVGGGITGKGEVGGGLLQALGVPRIGMEGTVEASGKGGLSSKQSQSVELHPIVTAERRLAQIAIVYHEQHRSRFESVADPSQASWYEPSTIGASPKKLVFLDLPGSIDQPSLPLTLIPTVAEFKDGKVKRIYERLIEKIKEGAKDDPDKISAPADPDRESDTKRKRELEKLYWKFFAEHFLAGRHAMVAVEDASTEAGRIQWIDYRLPLDAAGNTLHLHFCPNGEFDTGVFAYQLIRRGYKHGLRLVGTLKSGPALNVLAAFEK